jgi:pyrroline-5-carboxylate reductase
MSSQLAFIGGGNMARCLIGGLVAHGHDRAAIVVTEPQQALRDALARDFGVASGDDNAAAAAKADTIVLAVKPQVVRTVCASIAPALHGRRPRIVSIAAGVRIAQLQQWLGTGLPVIRAMPNTPALIGAGITGLTASTDATAQDRHAAEAVLLAAGPAVWIDDERLMDAVTAVSGSGPAYFFLLMESMQAAAIRQGLAADAARELVLHTALGAARMALESVDSTTTLRERVTSPGGTTQAALDTFAAGGFSALVDAAIHRATIRGRELSELIGD